MARHFEFRAVWTAYFVLVFFASPVYSSRFSIAQTLHARRPIERLEDAPPSNTTSLDISKILDQARSATGFSKLGTKRVLRATGKATLLGVPCEFSSDYSVDGNFRTAVEGDLEQIFVFDGRQGWEKSLFAGPFPLKFFNRDWAHLRAWVHSGYWLNPDAPLSIKLLKQDDPELIVLSVQLKDGLLAGRLELDAESKLPRKLSLPAGSDQLRIAFDDYATIDGIQLAKKVSTIISQGQEVVWSIVDGKTVDRDDSIAFRIPTRTNDTTFDSSVKPMVEVVYSRKRRLYLRPRINGKKIGLFVFDTGAGFSGISEFAAGELGLKAIGDSSTTGLGGRVNMARLQKIDTFQLGPLTIRNLVMTETAHRKNNMVNGEPVVGVIGWDLLMRSVLEFEPRPGQGGLQIYDPSTYKRENAEWCPLTIHYNVPFVDVKFQGDREGRFMVDTGAAGYTLYFFADVARQLGLRKDPKAAITDNEGAGGAFSTTLTQMEWLEWNGHRFTDTPIVLGVGEDGEVDPYSYGLIGGGLLRNFRLVFDYSRNRMLFIPLWKQ